MITKSSGFSLVELLVVVAIIGVIASVGVISYSGYVRSSNMKAAENIMTQISLAQTEYYSDIGTYYETTGAASNSCTTSTATNTEINTNLFGGKEQIDISDPKFVFCIAGGSSSDGGFKIYLSICFFHSFR